jgi:hypothetical protein
LPHGVEACVQTPRPLQAPTAVCTPAVHEALPHAVEPAGNVHEVTCTPSHDEPQVPLPEQAARAPPLRCAVPSTATQVPTLPPTSHAWHWPVHAVLQQTPSTQLPLAHSLAAAQLVPFGLAQCPTEPERLHA